MSNLIDKLGTPINTGDTVAYSASSFQECIKVGVVEDTDYDEDRVYIKSSSNRKIIRDYYDVVVVKVNN